MKKLRIKEEVEVDSGLGFTTPMRRIEYADVSEQTVCLVHANGMPLLSAIAAAPEMLEALKALYEHCSMVHKIWGEDCNQKQADAAIAAGLAAIAKAEGV